MSKPEIKKEKVFIDSFLDLDGSALSSSANEDIFNSADKPGELGYWEYLEEYKTNYSKMAIVRNRVLTARPCIGSTGFETAKTLNFKPRLKSTGMEFESNGEIYFGMHYPSYGKIYLLLDDDKLKGKPPCFVWKKTKNSSKLEYFFMSGNQLIIENLPLKPLEVNQVDALIDDTFKSVLLDDKNHAQLRQTIFKVAPVNRLITYSSDGKFMGNTNLDESDIDPAHRYTHVPKGWIMDKIRMETPGKVLESILIDDRDHTKHFKNKNLDFWIDCSVFSNYKFGSNKLAEAVKTVLDKTESQIYFRAILYNHFKQNLLALAPIFVEGFDINEKLKNFCPSQRIEAYSQYENVLSQHKKLSEDSTNSYIFIRLMLLCDDFVSFSKDNQLREIKEEEISVNPLDSLLEFANLDYWQVNYGCTRIFGGKFTPTSIQEIRKFLQKEDKDSQSYVDLLEIISEELWSAEIESCSTDLVIFLEFILQFQDIQSLNLSGFNEAAKIMIEEFRVVLGLSLPEKNLVMMNEKTVPSSRISTGVGVGN